GFPLADKLRAVRTAAAGGEAFVVANAYDADPDSPLSRTLLQRRPELVIDGIAIAARTVGASQTYLYIHPEAHEARSAAAAALARRKGALEEHGVAVELAMGPGGFMGGEESALLAVLESRRAMARQRPPFPAEQGLRMRPTLVSCAETLAPLPLIVRDGPEAFRIAGTSASRGTKLVSVTGAVARPGVYEVNFGSTLGEIVQTAGGATGAVKALHVGGPTGGLLGPARMDVRLDYEDLRAVGTHLGSGQIRVIAEGTCIVNEAARLFAYLAKETCAICVPCRVGTKRVGGILEGIYSGVGREDDLPWLAELGDHLDQFSLCGFGITSASILRTTMSEFADDYRAHITERRCPAGTCEPARTRRYETMVQP
ncbi:MAG: NADH-ubiquinone oxidoreductase-F iron-sulfur binding region domain-containing protein, partial [Candidatus Limnocylindria bacterium]